MSGREDRPLLFLDIDGPLLLVAPSLGLTDEDFAALDQWLRALRAFPRDPQEPETTRPTTR